MPTISTIGFAKFKTRGEAIDAREVLCRKRIDNIEWGLKAEIAKKNLKTANVLGKRGDSLESPTTILASFRVRGLSSGSNPVLPASSGQISPSVFSNVPSTDSIIANPNLEPGTADSFFLTSPQLPRDLLNPPEYPGFDKLHHGSIGGAQAQHQHQLNQHHEKHHIPTDNIKTKGPSSIESNDSMASVTSHTHVAGSSSDSSNDDIHLVKGERTVPSAASSSSIIPTRNLLSRDMPQGNAGGMFSTSSSMFFTGKEGAGDGRGAGNNNIMNSRYGGSMESQSFLKPYRGESGPNSASSIESSFSSSLGGGGGFNKLFGPDFNNSGSVVNSLMHAAGSAGGGGFFGDRSRTPPTGLLSPPVTPIATSFRGTFGGQHLASTSSSQSSPQQQQQFQHPLAVASSSVKVASMLQHKSQHLHHHQQQVLAQAVPQQQQQPSSPSNTNSSKSAHANGTQQLVLSSPTTSANHLPAPPPTSVAHQAQQQEQYFAQLQQQLQTQHASTSVQVSASASSLTSSYAASSPTNPTGPSIASPLSAQPVFSNPNLQARDQNPPCTTLYVGNLPSSTNPEELEVLFGHCRGYKRLCFRMRSNGPMCFVEFEDVMCASIAMQDLYGHSLTTHTKGGGIRLSFSKNPLGVRLNGAGVGAAGVNTRFGY